MKVKFPELAHKKAVKKFRDKFGFEPLQNEGEYGKYFWEEMAKYEKERNEFNKNLIISGRFTDSSS